MQTFLPSTSFQQSAKWLDRPGRLGKQRLEAIDCLKLNLHLNYDIPREILNFPEWLIKRYGNHPTRLMWSGYEGVLWWYCYAIIAEWRNVGYKDCCMQELVRLNDLASKVLDRSFGTSPPWLTEEFVSNHRSILLGKVKASYIAACNIEAGLRWQKDVFNNVPESELLKSKRRVIKCYKTQERYRSFGWTEQPAQKVLKDGQLVWPYLWPERN